MNRLTNLLGVLGGAFGVAGLIAYSVAPGQLWLVTLCEGIALICLVAFFVAHVESLKAFSARRSTRLGVHSLLMVLLFAAILVIVNFLAARHSLRWDFSETQHFTLAPQTHRVLRGLHREVKITVFTQDRGQAFNRYHDLLDSYRQASDKLKVDFVDPERRPGVARQYGISRTDTAVFESGTQSTRVTGPSEAELTGALIRISKDTKKRVLFLEGHGERGISDTEPGGLSIAKEALAKQGYDVAAVVLLQEHAVPKDASVLVLPGPQRMVTREEKDRIGRYVADGGRLLILLDPDSKAELDDLLRQWGIEAGKGVLVDLQDRLAQGDLTALMVRTFTEHEITQDFTFAVLFPVSRHLVFHDEAELGRDEPPRTGRQLQSQGGRARPAAVGRCPHPQEGSRGRQAPRGHRGGRQLCVREQRVHQLSGQHRFSAARVGVVGRRTGTDLDHPQGPRVSTLYPQPDPGTKSLVRPGILLPCADIPLGHDSVEQTAATLMCEF